MPTELTAAQSNESWQIPDPADRPERRQAAVIRPPAGAHLITNSGWSLNAAVGSLSRLSRLSRLRADRIHYENNLVLSQICKEIAAIFNV